jgi:tripeptidyl-peptidase-1
MASRATFLLLCLGLLLALTTLTTEAAPSNAKRSGYVVHEKRETVHPRWTKRDRVPRHKMLPMRIGLMQTNLEKAYDHLLDV